MWRIRQVERGVDNLSAGPLSRQRNEKRDGSSGVWQRRGTARAMEQVCCATRGERDMHPDGEGLAGKLEGTQESREVSGGSFHEGKGLA